MSEIHPNIDFDRFGRSHIVRNSDVDYGMHRPHQKESFIRCKKCGFCFDKNKITSSYQLGHSYVSTNTTVYS